MQAVVIGPGNARRVLLPVDDKGISKHAVEWYLKEIARPGDEAILLAVEPLRNQRLPSEWIRFDGTFVEDKEDDSQANIDAATLHVRHELKQRAAALRHNFEEQFTITSSQLRQSGSEGNNKDSIKLAVCMRRSGQVGSTVIEASNMLDANLIVMGSRGLGPIKRTFLGSVSDYVIHHSAIPVIIIHPEIPPREMHHAV